MSTLFAQQQALLQQQLQVLARIELGSSATPARTAPVQLAAALPPALGIAAMRPARAESLDSRPRFRRGQALRGNDIGGGRSPLSLTPSQTASTPYFSSSRTARRAEPGSSATHNVTPILPATLPAPNALTRIQRVAASCAASMGIPI